MEILKSILDWILKSSADPAKLSLTIKGFAPFLVTLFALAKVDIDVNSVLGAFTEIILILINVGTGLAGIVGLVRKIKNTINPPIA